MNIFEHYGAAVLLQHQGSQQIASAVIGSVRVWLRRLPKLLAGSSHRTPTASSS